MYYKPIPVKFVDKLLWPILQRFWAIMLAMLFGLMPVLAFALLMPTDLGALIALPSYVALFFLSMLVVDGSQERLLEEERAAAERARARQRTASTEMTEAVTKYIEGDR